MGRYENQKLKPNLLILILLIITVIAICITVWALFFRDTGPVLAPDYAPQEEEQNAETIPGDTGEKLDNPEGGGSVSLTYSREVSIDLSEETATLLFANPGKSNQNMVLQIVIKDTVIVQSGTLKPGNQVTTLELIDGMADNLSAGTYEGNFAVLYYHPETGEKAIVNTEIPITLTVNN